MQKVEREFNKWLNKSGSTEMNEGRDETACNTSSDGRKTAITNPMSLNERDLSGDNQQNFVAKSEIGSSTTNGSGSGSGNDGKFPAEPEIYQY